MKPTKILFLIITILLIMPNVFAVTLDEKTQIRDRVEFIERLVNQNSILSIQTIISPNANPELFQEIQNQIYGKKIKLEQSITKYEKINENKIRVETRFSAEGINWHVRGFKNYYLFEKHEGDWLLLDTDFHEKLSPRFVAEFTGRLFLIIVVIILLIGLPLFAFWLWMLIDAVQREFNDKTLWIVLIVLLGSIGAIIYFFAIRRKLKKEL